LESSYDEIGEILGKYYEIKEGNEFGAERARAIAAGEDTFQVGDKTFKVTDVDSEDKENAKDFVGENMKLSQLINKKVVTEAFKHIIHVDTPTQIVSKPVAAQIMALAKKGIRSKEIGLEMGFTGNAKLAADTFQKVKSRIYFELDKRESVNEGRYDADLDKIEAAVKNASSFMNVGSELKKAGIKYDFSTEMIPMYIIKVSGNTIAIVNKKYAAGAEREVGNYAIVLMKFQNLVKEVKKPKFGDTVHLKSQNKTGMVYSVKGNEVVIKTVSGLVKGKLSDAEIVMDEGNEFGAERARAIAAGEDTFTVGGKTYKVTDVDPQDKENAKDFVGEMKLSNLILKKKVNEATVKLSDLLKSVVDGSTSRVGSTKVDKKTAEKLLKLYKVGDVAMQSKFDKMTADKVISAFKPFVENKQVTNEVAPEGWEKTVKAMKDEPGIDNPWALAWWMKGRGFKSHKK
jgi:DNA-directed RNA polymerase subunit K/omega